MQCQSGSVQMPNPPASSTPAHSTCGAKFAFASSSSRANRSAASPRSMPLATEASIFFTPMEMGC
eukprot:scaffold159294_cov22-Tisochrysis_lutea.AAC.2